MIEVKGRQERRGKQLLNDLKRMRGYCELNEALYHSMDNSLGIGYGPVVRIRNELIYTVSTARVQIHVPLKLSHVI
jgi:hypothetical protein